MKKRVGELAVCPSVNSTDTTRVCVPAPNLPISMIKLRVPEQTQLQVALDDTPQASCDSQFESKMELS